LSRAYTLTGPAKQPMSRPPWQSELASRRFMFTAQFSPVALL